MSGQELNHLEAAPVVRQFVDTAEKGSLGCDSLNTVAQTMCNDECVWIDAVLQVELDSFKLVRSRRPYQCAHSLGWEVCQTRCQTSQAAGSLLCNNSFKNKSPYDAALSTVRCATRLSIRQTQGYAHAEPGVSLSAAGCSTAS
jgi:hypothetical protein